MSCHLWYGPPDSPSSSITRMDGAASTLAPNAATAIRSATGMHRIIIGSSRDDRQRRRKSPSSYRTRGRRLILRCATRGDSC